MVKRRMNVVCIESLIKESESCHFLLSLQVTAEKWFKIMVCLGGVYCGDCTPLLWKN